MDVIDYLSSPAGRTYRYLLTVPDAAVADVAGELDVDPLTATGLLDDLCGRGHAERRGDRYVAVPPATVLQPELLAREDELRQARVLVDELLELQRERSGGVNRYVELIESRDELQRRVLRLQTDATMEYLALVKATTVAVHPGESPVVTAEQVRAVFELDIL
ncbi:hypothetical protein, partial [Kribbella sp.]|uniref:hypothetical protein n=1 Tax=Kribbella sp. TaxID=1871183 RepID=UPI002D426EFB